jgi:DNA-binding transcriptional ArsR family regulator
MTQKGLWFPDRNLFALYSTLWLNIIMNQLDTALSALSHASRRAIIARLSREGPARVTEIAEPFDMSLNAVSKHLKVLEQAGLIRRTKVGRDHMIAFDPKPLKEIAQWVHAYEKFWTQHLDRLDEYFENKNGGKVK